jgi:hypothetical protein
VHFLPIVSNIAYPSSSAGAPRSGRGRPPSADAPRSDRATTLQVDEEANDGHYPPLSDVCGPILHRSS